MRSQLLLASVVCVAFSQASKPCDIYGDAGTPCVAAHSTVRALYSNFSGPLYQLKLSDGSKQDISTNSAGFADAAAHEKFCGSKTCVMERIYDQSPMGNHLDPSPPCTSCTYGHGTHNHTGTPVDAMKLKITLAGHTVYGMKFETSDGYRNDKAKGIAVGNEEESMYMVTSGKVYNGKCCFDYGNAENTPRDDGDGTMEAIYFGNSQSWGTKGVGDGPWVGADLENGMYMGGKVEDQLHKATLNPDNKPLTQEYVTAMLKGKNGTFVLKGNDATVGSLQTMYHGSYPPPAKKGSKPFQGYQPMKKEGAIILGIGGDNARGAVGIFYEGVMTKGFSTDAADEAVQANIVAVGYGSSMSKPMLV